MKALWAKRLLAALILPILTTACEFNAMREIPVPASYLQNSGAGLFGDPFGGTTDPSDPNYTCPWSENILPNEDIWYDGSMRFEACQNKNDKTWIKITGDTSSDSKVCIFPVEVVDETHIYLKPDLLNNSLVYKCVQANAFYYPGSWEWEGVEVKFAFTNYNALMMVEHKFLQQMLGCLMKSGGPDLASCPAFSAGMLP